MHEHEMNTQPSPAEQQGAAPTPRRTWERPALQRLQVSLDTAFTKGSNADLNGGSVV